MLAYKGVTWELVLENSARAQTLVKCYYDVKRSVHLCLQEKKNATCFQLKKCCVMTMKTVYVFVILAVFALWRNTRNRSHKGKRYKRNLQHGIFSS